ncbi:MAG: tetratricopeptide repeat protein, partial [Ktedonobacteraceae bacterium]|nr:tetratricopeptide repeat protein [Ktedonobacteraceae bacterium]
MQSEGSNIAASTNRALEVIDRQIARVPELEESLREEAQKVLLGLLQMRAEGLTLHEEIQKLDQRATAHRQQEHFVAARSIYSHMIDLYENERAKRGERTWYIKQDLPLAGTLDTMAEFLSELQQYQEAARYYWQALKICRKVYEDIINFDALALYDFAYGAVRQRNFPLAERYYHQALDYCLEHYAEDSALVARAQEEMGYFYMQSLQDFERAEKFLTEAAQTRMERFGEEH